MRKFALALIIFVSSCTSIEDVSNKGVVKISTGIVSTTKPLFLCAKDFDADLNTQLVINYGFEKCQSGKHITNIPVNSMLEIKKVIKHNSTALFSINRWLVLGQFKNIKFYYPLEWVEQTDGTFYYKNNEVPWK